MSSQALCTWFSPLKDRFRAPICATCKTAVGREFPFAAFKSCR
jgi:hypothetical protein